MMTTKQKIEELADILQMEAETTMPEVWEVNPYAKGFHDGMMSTVGYLRANADDDD
jgi:hypothetical protein